MAEAAEIDFGHAWKFALAFRWLGSRLEEGDAALMAAAAYARATGGVILDWDNGRLLSPDELRGIVHASQQSRPLLTEAMRRLIGRVKAERDKID
jgi:hypothetical protein